MKNYEEITPEKISKTPASGASSIKRGRLRRTNRQGEETKTLIREAAMRILREEGGEHLTFDRIARVADMSKGTLLYHYASKDALMEDLMEHYRDRLDRRYRLGRLEAEMMDSPVRDPIVAGFLEWYRCFHDEDASNTAYGLSILSLSARNDRMREVLQDWYRKIFAGLKSSPCGADALIAVLALEGLFFLRHFRMDMLDDEDVVRVLNLLETRCTKSTEPKG